MKGQTFIIFALVFALIVAIFAVINVEPVEVNYLFGTGNAPLILVIIVSALMGGIITAAVGVVRLIKLQREIKHLKTENKKLLDLTKVEEQENDGSLIETIEKQSIDNTEEPLSETERTPKSSE